MYQQNWSVIRKRSLVLCGTVIWQMKIATSLRTSIYGNTQQRLRIVIPGLENVAHYSALKETTVRSSIAMKTRLVKESFAKV